MTFMGGNALVGAAKVAMTSWRHEERPAVGRYTFHAPATTALDEETGQGNPNFSYGYVAEAAVVDVDTGTGQVTIRQLFCADDVGKAINPQQVKGQIEGALAQAIGYAITEDFQQDGGLVQTDRLSTYLIPGILEMPDRVVSMILENEDPLGPFGARGVAEMPLLPLAPAIVAAVHNATGVRIDQIPLTPERVFEALELGASR
jgi:CO/xanthine dehydrogenase Mo-binding subunit